MGDANIEKVLVSSKISLSEKTASTLLATCTMGNNLYKVKPLNKILWRAN